MSTSWHVNCWPTGDQDQHTPLCHLQWPQGDCKWLRGPCSQRVRGTLWQVWGQARGGEEAKADWCPHQRQRPLPDVMSNMVVNTIDGVKLYQGPLGLTFMKTTWAASKGSLLIIVSWLFTGEWDLKYFLFQCQVDRRTEAWDVGIVWPLDRPGIFIVHSPRGWQWYGGHNKGNGPPLQDRCTQPSAEISDSEAAVSPVRSCLCSHLSQVEKFFNLISAIFSPGQPRPQAVGGIAGYLEDMKISYVSQKWDMKNVMDKWILPISLTLLYEWVRS